MARIIHALTAIIVATVPIGLITDYITRVVAHQATPAALAGAVGQWRVSGDIRRQLGEGFDQGRGDCLDWLRP